MSHQANIKVFNNVEYPKAFEFFSSYESIDQISIKDLKILTKNKGIQSLFLQDNIDINAINVALKSAYYKKELYKIHTELVKMQQWIIANNKRVVIIIEGRDAAGKDGAIRQFIVRLNARHLSVNSLPKPTEEEKRIWYFQRYILKFPRPGDISFFNRSWYNRAVVEPVNAFCSQIQYERFMGDVNGFEDMLVSEGMVLIKIYFSIDYQEQKIRLKNTQESPLKRWKFSDVDARALELWADYTRYKEVMFEQTSTDIAPWAIINANDKKSARLTCMQYVLDQFDYI